MFLVNHMRKLNINILKIYNNFTTILQSFIVNDEKL